MTTAASVTPTKSSSSSDKNKTQGTVVVQAQKPATVHQPVQCWAMKRNNERCQVVVERREGEPIPIPYCRLHLKSGDYALKVVGHKLAGKCLVARVDLPAKYRIAFYGLRGKCASADKEDRSISYYPPHPITGSNCYPNTRTLKRNNYNGVLNPEGTGDILQYAACPGPNERQNIKSTFRYWGLRNGHMGGLEFITIEPIPKDTMLCHWYGSGWWSSRGVKRCDIGTTRYPAPKRRAVENPSDKDLPPSETSL